MNSTETAYFGVALFLALVMLMKWKNRREMVACRLNRGLQSYMNGLRDLTPHPLDQELDEDDPMIEVA